MTTIYIIADINGKNAIATFEIESLNWIPMIKDDRTPKDSLPFQIKQVGISNENGTFEQDIRTGHAQRTVWR